MATARPVDCSIYRNIQITTKLLLLLAAGAADDDDDDFLFNWSMFPDQLQVRRGIQK